MKAAIAIAVVLVILLSIWTGHLLAKGDEEMFPTMAAFCHSKKMDIEVNHTLSTIKCVPFKEKK